MPKVIFIKPDGREISVAVKSGTSARDAALNNNVPGIDGDCGGCCACATCHVYVDAGWIDRTGKAEADGMEASLLQFVEGASDASRLACQISVTDELDGLVLRLPDGQH
ncbi:MAG: 2Fe-2S iron-sulfur cluster binding domain-containing protein [Hyphomonadaceae bacterium]|nr:2Fe-2S iron-sulfur cluster binding domain-containing protein [Hyphomonadaceae bacterium]